MSGDRYVVEIKSSARRANGAVGRVVYRQGVRREFDGREAAETWAAGLTSRGGRHVWIRRANPNDPAPVDAYLMGRRPPPADERDGDGRPTGNGVADDGALAADWDPDDATADGDGSSGDGTVPEYGDLTAIRGSEDGTSAEVDGPNADGDGASADGDGG